MRTPIAERITQIETEYGQPFLAIIKGFAADGESRAATAAILGIPTSTFGCWLQRSGIEVDWPPQKQCAAWREYVTNRPRTPALQASARRNAERARAAAAQAARERSALTPELLRKVGELRSTTPPTPWRQMPARLGITMYPENIKRRYLRSLNEQP